MVTRKTQYAWMAMGGMLCLFGVVLACKLRDANKAAARDGESKPVAEAKLNPPKDLPTEPPPPATMTSKEDPKPPLTPVEPPPKKEAPIWQPTRAEPPPPEPDFSRPTATPPSLPMETEPVKVKAPSEGAPSDPPPLPEQTKKEPVIQASSPPQVPPGVDPPAIKSGSAPLPPISGKTGDPLAPDGPPPQKTPDFPDVKVSPPNKKAEPEQPGEPPLAPQPGPVETYKVRHNGETMRGIAKHTLGTSERWNEIARLNPHLSADATLPEATVVRLPADACIQDEVELVKPLPSMRPKATPTKPKAVPPLTGTFPCNLDDKKVMVLPKAIREQLGGCETLMVSPGPDQCLWLTNQAHLDRLAEKLEHSPAKELDVRVFKRLYFAQTEKTALGSDGRVTIPDRLAQFAGLQQEVVLIGIDDHFEVWDAAKWKEYTQKKSAAARAAMAEVE
jgi:MraZ protein